MVRQLYCVLLIVFSLACLASVPVQAAPVAFDWLEAPADELALEDVRALPPSEWQRSGSSEVFNRGFSDGSFWLKIEIPPEPANRVMEIGYPLLDEVSVHWVLNGEKWWASGAGDPRCKVYIVMTCSDPDAEKHARHSMFVVSADTPGIEVLRPMEVFGHDDAPHGHMHIRFTDVRVPEEDLILGRGRGFEVAQGRLGPGRIHHCMRAIGQAERALEMLCKRALNRTAFKRPLADLGANHDIIANARMEIEMARLLCLKAAWMMDTQGVRAAQPWISKIKVVAPLMATKVVDEAMQIHGGAGISQDYPLASMWTNLRTLRFADGPDAVHRRQIARAELRKYTNEKR